MLSSRMRVKLLCVLCIAAIVLAACSTKKADPHQTDLNEPFVLRVGASDPVHFIETYYDILAERFPQMQLEFLQLEEFITEVGVYKPKEETYEQTLERQYKVHLENKKFDMLVYSTPEMNWMLTHAGLIEPLDPLIKRDQYSIDSMYKPVIDKLRSYGDGQLYGLAMFYAPNYITFINHDLFNQMGVPVPQAPYTWNDLIEIGGRFAGQSESTTSHLYESQRCRWAPVRRRPNLILMNN